MTGYTHLKEGSTGAEGHLDLEEKDDEYAACLSSGPSLEARKRAMFCWGLGKVADT